MQSAAACETPGVAAVGARGAVIISLSVAAVALVGFAAAEVLNVKLLVDPVEVMTDGWGAAGLGVGLLVADIVLPVPASLVMLAHGALFGVVPGAALSLVGRTGNAMAGVALGRGAGRLYGRRVRADRGHGGELVERWGLVAVVVSRPIPMLAESVVVAAGSFGLSAPAIVGAAALGSVPEALLYALAGAVASSFGNMAIVFGAVVVLAAGVGAAGAMQSATKGEWYRMRDARSKED